MKKNTEEHGNEKKQRTKLKNKETKNLEKGPTTEENTSENEMKKEITFIPYSVNDISQRCEEEMSIYDRKDDKGLQNPINHNELQRFSEDFFEDSNLTKEFLNEVDQTRQIIEDLQFCNKEEYSKKFESLLQRQTDSKNKIITSVIRFFRNTVQRNEKLMDPKFLKLYTNGQIPQEILHTITETEHEDASIIIEKISQLRILLLTELSDDLNVFINRDDYPHTLDLRLVEKEIAKITSDQKIIGLILQYLQPEMEEAYKIFIGDSHERRGLFDKEIKNIAPYISEIEGLNTENASKIKQIVESQATVGKEKISGEHEKTAETNIIINFVNAAANDILRKYSRQNLYSPDNENIHLLPEMTDGKNNFRKEEMGDWDNQTGSIKVAYENDGDEIKMSVYLFHELIHAKSYNSLAIEEDPHNTGKKKLTSRRSGIGTFEWEKRMWLRGFNEAIVQKLTRRFYEKNVKNSNFFTQSQKDNFDESEFELIYLREQLIFDQLITTIYQKNQSKFKSPEEVEDIFIEAVLSGEKFKIERLIDSTFGDGTSEKLGSAKFYSSQMIYLFKTK